KLAFVLSGPRFAGGLRTEQGEIDFSDLKAILEHLISDLGTRGVRYQPPSQSSGHNSLYHPGQSADIWVGSKTIGSFGLLHPAQAKVLKTRGQLWLAELDWEGLTQLSRKASDFPTFQ